MKSQTRFSRHTPRGVYLLTHQRYLPTFPILFPISTFVAQIVEIKPAIQGFAPEIGPVPRVAGVAVALIDYVAPAVEDFEVNNVSSWAQRWSVEVVFAIAVWREGVW